LGYSGQGGYKISGADVPTAALSHGAGNGRVHLPVHYRQRKMFLKEQEKRLAVAVAG